MYQPVPVLGKPMDTDTTTRWSHYKKFHNINDVVEIEMKMKCNLIIPAPTRTYIRHSHTLIHMGMGMGIVRRR